MFNTALLAKQCWRLLQNQQSLFFRVFKAKYFPSCSFLDVQLGSAPSFLWRSFLSGRELLMKGIRWVYKPGSIPKLVWSETKTGIFSVKSAYALLEQTSKEETKGESSDSQVYRWFWRKFGNSASLARLSIFSGGPSMNPFPQIIIFIGVKSVPALSIRFVFMQKKQPPMFSGSVHWLGIRGLLSRVACKNFQIVGMISRGLCYGLYRISLRMMWKNGLQPLGQSGS